MKTELRLQNVIFQCLLDKNFYNAIIKQPYAITIIAGVIPNPKGEIIMNMKTGVICEDCWKKNLDKEGLQFKEPSKIVVPESGIAKLKN